MSRYILDASSVTASWTKSSHSGAQSDCVEVAALNAGPVAIRDSKDPTGPALLFGTAAVEAFIADVKAGMFDL